MKRILICVGSGRRHDAKLSCFVAFCMLPVKTIRGNKNVSVHTQLCPIIVKAQRAPNAQSTLQIVDRHYEEQRA
jgi:hypothetical protein